MNKLIILLACLVVSSVSHAATGTATASFDKDPDILLASNDKTWSYAAYKSNGLANVREFHDMGKSGGCDGRLFFTQRVPHLARGICIGNDRSQKRRFQFYL